MPGLAGSVSVHDTCVEERAGACHVIGVRVAVSEHLFTKTAPVPSKKLRNALVSFKVAGVSAHVKHEECKIKGA